MSAFADEVVLVVGPVIEEQAPASRRGAGAGAGCAPVGGGSVDYPSSESHARELGTRSRRTGTLVICYLDTSAAMKLLVAEAESAALTSYVQSSADERQLVTSWLLHIELHRAANRHPNEVDLDSVVSCWTPCR